jgi:hypothetical protein
MSVVVIVKQTVENGEKIKGSLDDLRVHLSHNGSSSQNTKPGSNLTTWLISLLRMAAV